MSTEIVSILVSAAVIFGILFLIGYASSKYSSILCYIGIHNLKRYDQGPFHVYQCTKCLYRRSIRVRRDP